MHPLKDKACIVGVGETPYTRGTDRSQLSQILHATMAALDDAGLKPHHIDGMVLPMPMPTVEHLAANRRAISAAPRRSRRCRRRRWRWRWGSPAMY
jgi:hypothetical protein